jgi:hypothetical protein
MLMQELIEGCVAVRLLASGKEFIARARREERAMNWKGAACCYVNAARQLGHLPGQTELRAKALGRAGLCFSRAGELEQAAMCYQDSRRLCVFLGEEAALDCLWSNIKIVQQKIYHRRHYVDMRTVSAQAEGQAAVGVQERKDRGNPPSRGGAVAELREDRVGVLLLAGGVLRDGSDQVDEQDGRNGGLPNVPASEQPLRDRQPKQHAV